MVDDHMIVVRRLPKFIEEKLHQVTQSTAISEPRVIFSIAYPTLEMTDAVESIRHDLDLVKVPAWVINCHS